MNIGRLKYFCSNYAVLLLLLFFITEAYFKIILFSTGRTSILLQVTKGITLFGVTFYLIINKFKDLLGIVILFTLFLIGQITLFKGMSISVLIAFVKSLFPIVLLLFFSTYKFSEKQKKQFFEIFQYIILFNSIFIIIGFLFNIQVLSSYLGRRFGFNGLFVTSATSSYVYCITLIYLFSKYKKSLFRKVPNLIIILSMFFIGTKVSYLFLACFILVYFLKYTKINKNIIIISFVSIVVIGLYLFFFKYGMFNEIRIKDGLMSSVMSHRDKLFLEKTIPYIQEHWSFLNYLFGGVSDLSTKSQIEFVDIFYFFGIIGGGVYYFIFFKAFITFKSEIYIIILLALLFIIVLLAGNFFSYPSIAIYLVILREHLNSNEQNQHTQHAHS